MSEDVKPDPVFDKLGRFTPDASGIDRDEWLFRAGRASARTPRGWKAAVGVLAITQVATFAAWLWTGGPRAPTMPTEPPAIVPTPVDAPGADYRSEPSSYNALTRTFDPDTPPQLPPAGPAARPAVSLTAGWRGTIE